MWKFITIILFSITMLAPSIYHRDITLATPTKASSGLPCSTQNLQKLLCNAASQSQLNNPFFDSENRMPWTPHLMGMLVFFLSLLLLCSGYIYPPEKPPKEIFL